MKNFFLAFILLTAFCHPAGTSAQVIDLDGSTTRAVVVGISDYQHKDIPDLQFADRDAEAFAAWLRSPAGGSVPAENIQLLTNEKATTAQFASALDGLLEVSREGDIAIIYFSGHGDVETKTMQQNGFLLCHDSPARTYVAGAYPLWYLQNVVSTLSLQNKTHVVVVTDACHAGKLAGSAVNGAELTNANLAKQYAEEVKIMSCQPNEFSLEGVQWGGGRGAFSFNLVEGLTGLADQNSDGKVNLFEIGRYLEDKVPAETAPQSQMPLTVGNRQTLLASVDATSLERLKKEKSGQLPQMMLTKSKGFEDVFLAGTDSLTQQLYRAFQAALEKRQLLAPPGICANDLYAQLLEKEELAGLHNLMRRNFAAALQDEVQQAINSLLDDDPYEVNQWNYNPDKYADYPRYLERAMELLGGQHYMHTSLKSKKLYFEAYLMSRKIGKQNSTQTTRDSVRTSAKKMLLEAIRYEPAAAYLYHAVGDLYFTNVPAQSDSLTYWCERASEISPDWLAPMLEIAYEHQAAQIDLAKAVYWTERACAVRPDSYFAMERLSWLRQWQGRSEESKAISMKMIEQRPDLFNAYATLAHTYYYLDGDLAASEAWGRQAIALNPHPSNWAYHSLPNCQIDTRHLSEALEMLNWLLTNDSASTFERGVYLSMLAKAFFVQKEYKKAVECIHPIFNENLGTAYYQTIAKYWQARALLAQGLKVEAEKAFLDALEVDQTPNAYDAIIYAWLGEMARQNKQLQAAEAFYQKALHHTFPGDGLDSPIPREEAFFLYGKFLLAQNRLDEAETNFQQSRAVRPKGNWGCYGMALLAAQRHQETEALDWLEKSLDNFYPDSESIMEEPLFKKIRKTKRFKAQMEKHFPHP